MYRESQSKYFWPSSAITPDDMDILYRARESNYNRIPITKLIALAVRKTYGPLADTVIEMPETAPRKEAA